MDPTMDNKSIFYNLYSMDPTMDNKSIFYNLYSGILTRTQEGCLSLRIVSYPDSALSIDV